MPQVIAGIVLHGQGKLLDKCRLCGNSDSGPMASSSCTTVLKAAQFSFTPSKERLWHGQKCPALWRPPLL